jgi:4-amino-4-deoxy-L-arabinose transferase-like glycosyltransferase
MDVSPSSFDQFARGWRSYFLVAMIALASALFGAGRMQVMDTDEARFAQASRQMVETGDYISIHVQDEERNRKPIGVHWLQAASVNAFSLFSDRTNEIFAYRLPSALGLALAAVATLWAGAALVGQRQALLGAALLAASMLAGLEGMTAKADAVLLGLTTLAMAALARLRFQAGEPRLLALIFWLAIGSGVLVKGPVAPLVAALTLASLAVWERRWAWMKPLVWWPGPLLALAIVAPWSIAISRETEGRFFQDMIFDDLLPKLVSGEHFRSAGLSSLPVAVSDFPRDLRSARCGQARRARRARAR